jgi:prepilin-type processing-associated H-X9-DG protein
MAKKNTPKVIEDAELEGASGGLLPAIQKVREAAITDGTSSSSTAPTPAGGINVALADGSVRTI